VIDLDLVVAVQETFVFEAPTTNPPRFRKMTISNTGVVKVYFTQNLNIPSQISMINSTSLDVTLSQKTSYDKRYLGFTWKISEFFNNYM
jgi:hypothetical protein